MLAHEQEHERAVGVLEVLHVVHEHVTPARRDARADMRALAEQAQRAQHEVAGVERALLAQHRVVGVVDGRELALARGALVAGGQGGRPAGELGRGHHRVLEAVDACDHAAQQDGRVAEEVVQAQRQLVDAVEQHRQPVGRRGGHDERVEPRLERLVVEQARGDAVARCARASSAKPPGSASSTPSRSASAAASEEVMATTASGASPPSPASHAWRASRVRVLPVPAAPTTSSGPPRWVTTSRCAGVSASGGSGTSLVVS